MTTRPDISVVPFQGGYIARTCPVVIQNRMLVPELEIAERSPDALMRMQDGIDFEATLIAELAVAGGDTWLLVPGELKMDEAQQMTIEAMVSGQPIIHNGYLPADQVGRRTGRPDLLVYYDGGYVPVDLKHRKTLNLSEESIDVSDLLTPDPGSRRSLVGHSMRTKREEALQLAHYRRMLEALGYASASTFAGIIGKDQVVVWYDLDEPMWTTPSTSDPSRKQKKRSTLDVYDFEFNWRLDIAVAAIDHRDKGGGPLLVEPMWCGECGECGFVGYCSETLDQGSGDVSKIPGNQYSHWRTLRNSGIRKRDQVAALHYPTAALSREGVEVARLMKAAQGVDQTTPVAELLPRARRQIENLTNAGIVTVGDLERLDPLTASLGGFVANQILDARAATGAHDVYRRPGKDGTAVPRADVEIDIDMENMNEGVYMWGVLLTDHSGSGLFEEGYRAFTTWDDLDEQTEQGPFNEMLQWLARHQDLAAGHGLSLQAYVWYEAAENTQLRRIAANAGPEAVERIETMIQSDAWIDLRKVFNESWMTGGSSSLKVIAPLAGHAWPVDDPGGGLAMVKYTEAAIEDSAEARKWLLEYNRGDVEATRAIREWLHREGASWPEIATD